MSTAVLEPKTETPAFDPAKFMEARNTGKTPEPAKVEAKAEPAKPAEVEPDHQRPSRSYARLQRSLGREQALREQAEGELAKLRSEQKPAAAEEAEPQRSQFANDAEYLRATQKWDRQQEAREAAKTGDQTQQSEQYRAHLKAMDEKADKDIASLDDWDEVSKKAAEDEDAPEFVPSEHPTLMAMLAASDMKAFVLYHFAKHPEEMQKMLDLTKTQDQQIRAFHRLEGRLEKMYDSKQAAQAPENTTPKDRKHLAEAERPGETAAGAIPAKPKPSSEVAARGGSPAPDEPLPGTPAWMSKRNQAQFGK